MFKITNRVVAISDHFPICTSATCNFFSNKQSAHTENVVKPMVLNSLLNKKATNCYSTRIQLRWKSTGQLQKYFNKRKKIKVHDGTMMITSEFENMKNKNREAFLDMIRIYNERYQQRFKHVDFINAALKQMEAFGVHEDLEVYKKLLNIFPKGRYIPSSILLADLDYYPEQLECGMEIMDKISFHGIYPDQELDDLLLNIFGQKSRVYRKFRQLLYWAPKIRFISPWPLPNPLPDDALELAKLAIARITSVDPQTVLDVYRTEDIEDSLDKTWIVSGQSPAQIELLKKHDKKKPVIVEGGDRVYLRKQAINYFILKSDEEPYEAKELPDPDDISHMDTPFFNPVYKYPETPTVHEQDGETIYAVCATGTSSKDSLLSWIRLLQEKKNPILGEVAVLFRFRMPETLPVPHVTDVDTKEEKNEGASSGS